MPSFYNHVSYHQKFQVYIGRPETVLEASIRYDQEKKHALSHSHFCKATFCVYHYSF